MSVGTGNLKIDKCFDTWNMQHFGIILAKRTPKASYLYHVLKMR